MLCFAFLVFFFIITCVIKFKTNIVGIMLLVIELSVVTEDPKSFQLFLINLVLSVVKLFFSNLLMEGRYTVG